MNPISEKSYRQQLNNYYRFHSKIYDATRWSFLFGRSSIIDYLPELAPGAQILDIGCGTGTNLIRLLKRYPEAHLTGIDLSPEMLEVATKKIGPTSSITLQNKSYQHLDIQDNSIDVILLSYSLTMMQRDYLTILNQLKSHLKPNGILAAVDFHTSPLRWFRSWMEFNHVDFSGNLYPKLNHHFNVQKSNLQHVYLGLWNYFHFIGSLK